MLKKEKCHEQELRYQLNECDKRLSNMPNEEIIKEREELCKEIEQIEDRKLKGIQIRSKEKYYEAGEKSTKFFFNLEKKNAIKSHIRKLKNSAGKDILNTNEILKMQKDFYTNLFNEKQTFKIGKFYRQNNTLNAEQQKL